MVKLFRKDSFYKDIKLIMFCKVCKVQFRPERFSWQAGLGLCAVHRKAYKREQSKKYPAKPLTPEQKVRFYQRWLVWVKNNIERRRKIALTSYHKRKDIPKNRARKHRRTKN